MRSRNPHPQVTQQTGLTLLELLVAALLSAVLIMGLVQIVTAASNSFRLQDNQAEVQENGRYALATLGRMIRQTGYVPHPWNEGLEAQGLTTQTQDQVTSRSDRLAIRFWSDTNCFDNRNPIEDSAGEPAFHIRESLFDLNDRNDLTHTCRYGPTPSEFVTQVNHHGFVRNVESFQALYGEDTSGDGLMNRWVKGGEWTDQEQVLGIRIGLLLCSSDSVVEASGQSFQVLDSEYVASADGKLRQLLILTTAIKGRGR
jgi:type IV pilus assembly protein PilW